MSILYRLYRPSKVRLNYLLDRIVDLCDMVLMDAYRFPWPAAQNVAQGIARYVGDVCWLLKDFPRLSAYELIGADWRIIFVGGDGGLRHICHLLFEEEVDPEELGRIPLWKLSAQTQQWLAEGVDLVVCELSRIHPRPPRAPLTFTVPTWIEQTLAIPEPLETLIAGKRFRGLVNRAQKAGFAYRFSQSKADFDHFYHHMYLPFVKKRHGGLALVAPYQDQWRWFTRGGLVLVTQDDKPLAGMICYLANDTCFPIEGGILEADRDLWQQGINVFLFWCAMVWGHDQGAESFSMGPTRAWRCSGAFTFKRRWGAQVARYKRIHRVWTFLAQSLSPPLQDHLSKLGLISEANGKLYDVAISHDSAPMEETDLHDELLAAQEHGLAGLAVISPNGRMVVYDSAS